MLLTTVFAVDAAFVKVCKAMFEFIQALSDKKSENIVSLLIRKLTKEC